MAVTVSTHSLTEESYDVATNSSVVRYLVKLTTNEQSHNDNNITTTYYIDGVKYTKTHKLPLRSTTTVVDKTVTIIHNADGTRSVAASFSTPTQISAGTINRSIETTLTTIPRKADLTSAPDFNDEANPKITYSNLAGNAVDSLQACISLTGANADIAYRDISKTGSEYTFNLTTAERNVLRNNCTTSNSRTVVFIIKTVIGQNTYYSSVTKTLSIINATPTAGSLSYADTNSTVTAITQNNQHIVRNNSTLRVTYGAATALKGASIANYKITFNGATQTKTSSGDIDYGTVNISSNTTVTVVATDTRGNTVSTSKTIIIYDWILPSAIITLNRVNNYEDSTKLKVQVTISSVNSKNAIQSIKWRSKKTSDSSWLGYTSINNNTEYTITKDKTFAWNFQIEIKDKFGTTTYNLTLGKGTAVLYIDAKNLAVGINAYPSANESLNVEGNFKLSGNLLIGSSLTNVDANNIVNPGIYYLKTGCSNVPTNWFYLIPIRAAYDGSPDMIQLGFDPSCNMYIRFRN